MIVHLFSIAIAVSAQAATTTPTLDVAPFVHEASQKTGVPEPVIWAVLGAESAGNLRATSPKGALGLMQLMPKTWSMLRGDLGLGSDIFDPHDNIIAGTYYLRYLYDRYGWDGIFAAYNAGPGRYESHRDLAQSLPAETQAYIVRISEKLGGKRYEFAPRATVAKAVLWTETTLFIADTDDGSTSAPGFVSTSTPFVPLPVTDSQTTQSTH